MPLPSNNWKLVDGLKEGNICCNHVVAIIVLATWAVSWWRSVIFCTEFGCWRKSYSNKTTLLKWHWIFYIMHIIKMSGVTPLNSKSQMLQLTIGKVIAFVVVLFLIFSFVDFKVNVKVRSRLLSISDILNFKLIWIYAMLIIAESAQMTLDLLHYAYYQDVRCDPIEF
jgi:hypothetical protein